MNKTTDMTTSKLPETSVIILEGPDGVGKSTAAKSLSNWTGWDLFHMGQPDEDFNYASDYFASHNIKHNCVLDRFHLGALVYGRICRLHPHRVTDETLLYTQLRLKYEYNAQVIVMYFEDARAYARHIRELAGKRDELFDPAQCVLVNESYRRIAGLLGPATKSEIVLWPVDRLGYPDEEVIQKWAVSKS